MGNLRSVSKALEHVAPEAQVVVTADPALIRSAERVVVPGQGALPDCMRSLAASGAREAVLVLNQGRQRTKLERSCRPADWLFSGWNWTAKILSRATAQVKGTP